MNPQARNPLTSVPSEGFMHKALYGLILCAVILMAFAGLWSQASPQPVLNKTSRIGGQQKFTGRPLNASTGTAGAKPYATTTPDSPPFDSEPVGAHTGIREHSMEAEAPDAAEAPNAADFPKSDRKGIDFSISIAGAVSTPDGSPPKHAVVSWTLMEEYQLTDGSLQYRHPRFKCLARCNDRGEFQSTESYETSKRSAITATVVASAEGWAKSRPVKIRLENGVIAHADLKLRGLGKVTGQVVDEWTQPISEIAVTLESEDERDSRKVITDEAGQFEFVGVVENDWIVTAHKESHVAARGGLKGHCATVTYGQVAVVPRIVLVRQPVLRVNLQTTQGEPILAGFTLRFVDGTFEQMFLRSQVVGEAFEEPLPISPGKYQLSIKLGEGKESQEFEVHLLAGQITDLGILVFRLPAAASGK